MEPKDWLTLIALITTIVSSHWLASKQTKKSKKAKWIDDFRFEIARFFSLSSNYNRGNIQTLLDLSASSWVLLMLLNESIPQQDLLYVEITNFGLFMTKDFDGTQLTEFKDRLLKIKDLSKAIIMIEEKKL